MDYSQFTDTLAAAFGDSILKPAGARLGNPTLPPTSDRINVPLTETEQPGMVYIFDVVGETQGVTMALNSGPGKLAPRDLVFGQFILVRKVNEQYVISGVDYQTSAEYIHGVTLPNPEPVQIGQINYGMLQPTNPRSMRAFVSGATYGGEFDVPDTETADQTANIPATAGNAVAVLVTLDPTDGTLAYDVGSAFDATLSHQQAFATYYPKNADTSLYTVGWIRLQNGMTAILEGVHLYARPEYLNKGGGVGGSSAIVVAEGDGQAVGSSGSLNYVWNSPDTDTGEFWAMGDPELLVCAEAAVYHASVTFHLEWITPPSSGTVTVQVLDSFSALGWVADWKREIGTQGSVWATISGGRLMQADETLHLYIENNTDESLDVYARITLNKV